MLIALAFVAGNPVAAASAPEKPAAELLQEALRQYDQLEYEAVLPIAAEVLARDGVDIEIRLQIYLLQGSSLAIVGDTIEAEKSFRFLLRGHPDYTLTPETPPKIVAIFSKVKAEEQAITNQLRALQLKRTIAELRLEGDIPTELNGGEDLTFAYSLRDPRGAVAAVSVYYRRSGESAYSSLALETDATGRWRGDIPAQWTASDDGFTLEYYVSTFGNNGEPLLGLGDDTGPTAVQVAAGDIASATPFYRTYWFWALAGLTAAVIGVGTGVAIDQTTRLPASDALIYLP